VLTYCFVIINYYRRRDINCQCAFKCRFCQLCFHMLTCSCPDSSVSSDACKHCHLVKMNFLDESESSSLGIICSFFAIFHEMGGVGSFSYPESSLKKLWSLDFSFTKKRFSNFSYKVDLFKVFLKHFLFMESLWKKRFLTKCIIVSRISNLQFRRSNLYQWWQPIWWINNKRTCIGNRDCQSWQQVLQNGTRRKCVESLKFMWSWKFPWKCAYNHTVLWKRLLVPPQNIREPFSAHVHNFRIDKFPREKFHLLTLWQTKLYTYKVERLPCSSKPGKYSDLLCKY